MSCLQVTKVLSTAAFESGSVFTAGATAQGKENTGTLSLGAAPRLGGRAEGSAKRPASRGLAGPAKRARAPAPSAAKALTVRFGCFPVTGASPGPGAHAPRLHTAAIRPLGTRCCGAGRSPRSRRQCEDLPDRGAGLRAYYGPSFGALLR